MVIKISGLSWTVEFEVYGKTVHTFVYASDTKEKAKKPNYLTVPAAIRELEKIELIRQSDWGYRMDYAVTATQKEILKAFNMTAANIRTQAAAMNEYLMQIEKEG